jgi:hypothetical protein
MSIPLTRHQAITFATVGFSIWLSGAVMFRFGGRLMFESGPWMVLLSAVGVAISVCLLLNAVMAWQGAVSIQALPVAVIMALPGLFGDVVYILCFHAISGLRPLAVTPFAAVVIFGNATLLTYALVQSLPIKD